VLVVGGGNSAGEEGIFLTKFASKVTLLTRDPELSASRVVVEKVNENPAMDVIVNSSPVEFKGDGRLGAVVIEDQATKERRELNPAGVFVFIGLSPNTGLVKDLVEVDRQGFVMTDPALQTNVLGVFAAGDCRAGSTKQAASAAGEGAAVALSIRRYLEPFASGMPRREQMKKEMVHA